MTRFITALLGFATACGGGALAAQGGLALLARVPVGSWQLHATGSDDPPLTICVRNPAQLLQIQHPQARCARYVLSQDAKTATVQYTCPRTGQGRTTLTIVDDGEARIATQGIANAAPFDVEYEARRVGPCI